MPPRSTESLAVGVAGLGYIGTAVGTEFRNHPDASVTAVCDPNDDRLSAAGDLFDVDEAARFRSYDRLIERAPIDAVVIGTPHTLHYEQVIAALDASLHVYCDKPLTTDVARAREIVNRDARSDRTVMVGYQRRLQEPYRRARERFRTSSPRWLSASITQDWIAEADGTWRLDPELSGGGFLYDTGSHVVDAVCFTSGLDPVSVVASMDFHDDETIDRRAHLDVEFAGGATASIACHGAVPAVREHLYGWDTDGAVCIDGRGWGARRFRRIDADGEYRPTLDPRTERTRAEAFVESVRSDVPPPATTRDGAVVTALIEAAYQAGRADGPKRVPVETDFGEP